MSVDSKEQTTNTRDELEAYQFPQLSINERARRRNILNKVENGENKENLEEMVSDGYTRGERGKGRYINKRKSTPTISPRE